MGMSVIAIDGPAASGKSTIGRLLAEQLGYIYLDTGVMYRAVTWTALDRHVPIEDEDAVSRLANELRIDVLRPTADDGRQCTVLVDGQDITLSLRLPQVDHGVSPVSAYPGVRAALTEEQRRMGGQGRIVMVGRDIGTVVLPQADLKIYLDAALEERANRRYREILARGERAVLSEVLEAVRRRDEIDSSRSLAPLQPADDAVVVDSTLLSVEQVLELVLALVQGRSCS